MSALPACLLGLAGLFAAMGSTRARRARTRAQLPGGSGERRVPPPGRSLRSALPPATPWACAGLVVAWVLFRPVSLVVGPLGGLVAFRLARRRREVTRRAERDEQLADAVAALAAALRAGLSIPQALGYASREIPPPLGSSLAAAVSSMELGTPMETVVERWAETVDTDDARLLAGVLRLHRKSGGDLPRVLDEVTATLRDRRAVAREVRGLTAQARLSGAILGCLPIGFFAFLWLTSRSDIEGAFHQPVGIAALALGLVMELTAFLWIRSLLEVT